MLKWLFRLVLVTNASMKDKTLNDVLKGRRVMCVVHTMREDPDFPNNIYISLDNGEIVEINSHPKLKMVWEHGQAEKQDVKDLMQEYEEPQRKFFSKVAETSKTMFHINSHKDLAYLYLKMAYHHLDKCNVKTCGSVDPFREHEYHPRYLLDRLLSVFHQFIA